MYTCKQHIKKIAEIWYLPIIPQRQRFQALIFLLLRIFKILRTLVGSTEMS